MDDIRISVGTAGPNSEITIVRVDGVIDTMTSTELEKVMNSLIEQKRFQIIIDLAGVEYISSAGWGIFISNIREIKANNGDIKLARMIPSVYEIFELLEFDSILRAYDNIERAKVEFKVAGSRSEDNPTMQSNPRQSSVIVETREAEIRTEEYRPQGAAPVSMPAAQTPVDTPIADFNSTEKLVLSLIKADPFYTISELVRMVNSEGNGSDRNVGWWGVWNILRRHSLLSKRNRFRYSRRQN